MAEQIAPTETPAVASHESSRQSMDSMLLVNILRNIRGVEVYFPDTHEDTLISAMSQENITFQAASWHPEGMVGFGFGSDEKEDDASIDETLQMLLKALDLLQKMEGAQIAVREDLARLLKNAITPDMNIGFTKESIDGKQIFMYADTSYRS